jgi:hypothetical protein
MTDDPRAVCTKNKTGQSGHLVDNSKCVGQIARPYLLGPWVLELCAKADIAGAIDQRASTHWYSSEPANPTEIRWRQELLHHLTTRRHQNEDHHEGIGHIATEDCGPTLQPSLDAKAVQVDKMLVVNRPHNFFGISLDNSL